MSDVSQFLRIVENRRGIVAVIIAISTVVFVGFAAFAIDLSHLFVVRNELQNAADAGALAGARFLYDNNGIAVNATANLTAYNAAIANWSEKVPVDVHWRGGNTGDIERGHWSFATRTFTPNDSLLPVTLWGTSEEELDRNPNFINAIRVRTRREDKPAASFLAGIFGFKNFILSTEAIAYIGFAGTLAPFEVDEPIAICSQSILSNGQYSCNVGRMINSGNLVAKHETAGWTDYDQVDPCLGGTNASDVRSLICGNGNTKEIIMGAPVSTNGGDIASAFKRLRDCWAKETGKTKPWKLTLLVIDCPGNNIRPCERVAGAVTVNIVWITGEGEDPQYNETPTHMENQEGQLPWSNQDPDGRARWNSFVTHFKLKNLDSTPAPYAKKSIYFVPDCLPHDPTGTTGGENFGILAKIPVLVK